jgi:glycosyltransferase
MVSIITATYNAAAHLRHCFASLAAQTVACEHIIVDGGSTDGSIAIIEEHCRSRLTPHASPRTRFLSEADRGLYDALNKGLRMASGEIIGLLHADDFYPAPDILAKVAAVFEDPAVEACYGDLLYVKPGSRDPLTVSGGQSPAGNICADHGSRITDHDYSIVRYWHSGPYAAEKFKWGWMPPHPTFFVRRAVYERYGVFNLDLGTAADYELMLRFLLRHHIRCAYLPEVLICMRVGGVSNASLQNRLRANRMDRQAWAVNGLRPYPWTILLKPLRKLPQWWQRPTRQAPGAKGEEKS